MLALKKSFKKLAVSWNCGNFTTNILQKPILNHLRLVRCLNIHLFSQFIVIFKNVLFLGPTTKGYWATNPLNCAPTISIWTVWHISLERPKLKLPLDLQKLKTNIKRLSLPLWISNWAGLYAISYFEDNCQVHIRQESRVCFTKQ